jgi:hypothetical protein
MESEENLGREIGRKMKDYGRGEWNLKIWEREISREIKRMMDEENGI